MNRRWAVKLMLVPPVLAILFFLYMTFVNSAYEHPGRIVYYSKCATCHGDHGEGTINLVPPLKHSETFAMLFPQVPSIIKNGLKDSILVDGKWYNQPMYPIQMNSVEMANLINFLKDSFWVTEKIPDDVNSIWVEQRLKEFSK